MAPYRAACTNDECDWGDRLLLREGSAKQQAATHHDDTGHTTVVSELGEDEVLHRFGD